MSYPFAGAEPPPFAPHPLLRNTHLMTAATQVPRRGLEHVGLRAERREVAVDPETRILVFFEWQEAREAAPTAVLVHGLSGSAEGAYMLGTADKLYEEGFNVARVNVRNCGETEHLCAGLFHSGLTDDVRHVLDLLVRQGLPRVYLVGFSMGGNIVVKLAGELGPDAPAALRGVMGVSAAIDLAPCAVALDTWRQNRLYKDHFLGSLCERYLAKCEAFPDRYDPAAVEGITSFEEFDDRVTAPAHGWADHHEYYREASARPWIPRVEVPTLLLYSRDDTIIPAGIFDAPEVVEHPGVLRLETDRGGHCGFIRWRAASSERWRDRDRYWAENRVAQFLCVLEHRAGARLVESLAPNPPEVRRWSRRKTSTAN